MINKKLLIYIVIFLVLSISLVNFVASQQPVITETFPKIGFSFIELLIFLSIILIICGIVFYARLFYKKGRFATLKGLKFGSIVSSLMILLLIIILILGFPSGGVSEVIIGAFVIFAIFLAVLSPIIGAHIGALYEKKKDIKYNKPIFVGAIIGGFVGLLCNAQISQFFYPLIHIPKNVSNIFIIFFAFGIPIFVGILIGAFIGLLIKNISKKRK